MLPPFRVRPILKQRPWGGAKLATDWNKRDGPSSGWAESWEVVDLGDDQNVVQGGPLEGATLHEVCLRYRDELLGPNSAAESFPVLFKFLDAGECLSVQVHPNDDWARRHALGQCGKSEAWVVLDAEADSQLFVGLKAGIDRAALEQQLAAGHVADCLHSIPARVGDAFWVPAGTVHAIGAGVSLAELQQSSDITLRLFDWNRFDAHGRARQLHISDALDCIDFSIGPIVPVAARELNTNEFGSITKALQSRRHEELIRCEHFIWRRHAADDDSFELPGGTRCRLLTVIEGAATIRSALCDEALSAGQTLIVPASEGRLVIEAAPNCVLLEATPA